MTLREYREATGLTQQEVARVLDIDQSTISLWENEKGGPYRKNHKRLAKLYNCSVADIEAECKRVREKNRERR